MKFSDPAYGKFEIKHEVLQDVIRTGALQRLKGINQYGTFQFQGLTISGGDLWHFVHADSFP